MVKSPNAVVLVLDRLGAGYLGPYGNTWIATPAVNRLASQSLLIEHALIDTPSLHDLYRSYWQGEHAMSRDVSEGGPNVGDALHEAGITTVLVTDEPRVARHPAAAGFQQVITVEDHTGLVTATDVSRTHLARLLARATEQLVTIDQPFLLWIHARAMSGPWDAPREFRLQFADEEDPVPPDFVEVPDQLLERDYDPDELLGLVFAYAGQVSALDWCLGGFVDALDAVCRQHETLFMLTSSRGFPLGEHLRVGTADEPLYHELLQVPCMTRFPDGLGATMRSQTLWQPWQMHATLMDWFVDHDGAGRPRPSLRAIARGDCDRLSQRACTVSATERAIRTPAWFLRVPRAPNKSAGNDHQCLGFVQQAYELFVKPDDRWDFNNVAIRCPNVAEQMYSQLELFQSAAHTGELDRLPEVPDDLMGRWA